MNTDSYYEIGHGHTVCEDYAISEQIGDFTFAIVSDGCSQSKNTDVGARLVSIIARDTIIYMYKSKFLDKEENEKSIPVVFQELFLKKCLETKATLNLSTDTFDATLLLAFVLNNKLYILGYGDGNIILKTNGNSLIIDTIEYESGAPYYLSYQLSHSKKQSYYDTYASSPIEVKSLISSDNEKDTLSSIKEGVSLKNIFSYWKVLNLNDFPIKSITLSSDGIGTYFKDKRWTEEDDTGEKEFSLFNVVEKMVDYKNTNGEFVLRRMGRMKRDMNDAHLLHDDDISCATISII